MRPIKEEKIVVTRLIKASIIKYSNRILGQTPQNTPYWTYRIDSQRRCSASAYTICIETALFQCLFSLSPFLRIEVAVTILSDSADTDAVLFVLVAKQIQFNILLSGLSSVYVFQYESCHSKSCTFVIARDCVPVEL